MWIHRHLFATCSSGLCNRLLVLAGSMRIAALTGRALALYWPVNEDLGCTFDQLFTNRFEMVTEGDLEHVLNTNFNVKVYNAGQGANPGYRAVRRDGDPDIHIVVIKGWSHPRFEDETHSPDVDSCVRQHLLSFEPQPDILQKVKSIPLPPATIGVHVRRGDHVEVFGQSKEEYFLRIMRGILTFRPDASFFLATDVAAVEERFRKEFGSALLSAPKQWAARKEFCGVREGLVDLLLLARTAGIIGTVHSSFSQTAGRLSGAPMFVADEINAGPRLSEICGIVGRCSPAAL